MRDIGLLHVAVARANFGAEDPIALMIEPIGADRRRALVEEDDLRHLLLLGRPQTVFAGAPHVVQFGLRLCAGGERRHDSRKEYPSHLRRSLSKDDFAWLSSQLCDHFL